MPWIACTSDGRRVIPEQIDDGVTVTCPDCGDDMHPRGPTIDGKARHFAHTSRSSTSCTGGGGESDTHRRMKSQVISALTQWFSDHLRSVTPERAVDVSGSASPTETRHADIHAAFSPPHPVFGSDLVVEVQYQNHSKPVESVTHDYVVAGHSVYWATEHEFTSDRFLIGELIAAFNRGDPPTYDGADGTVPVAVVASTASPLDFDPVPPEENYIDDSDVIHDGTRIQNDSPDDSSISDGTREVYTDLSEPIPQGETPPTTIPSTNPPVADGQEKFRLPETAPGEGFKIKMHNHNDYPDIAFVDSSKEIGWFYAGVPPHPPASIIDGLPRTTPDGHPIPHTPDCEHTFGEWDFLNSSRIMPTKCKMCGVTVYRVADEGFETKHDMWNIEPSYREYIARPYRSLPTPIVYFEGDSVLGNADGRDFAPYCGDRVWLVDFDADEYQCTTCGRRFPRANDALRDQYGDPSTDVY
jgi:predicted RNA-binding Zn-ribbon protein involved in translation (DUF1610 family)